MRETIADALKDALRSRDKLRTGTLRLINAAIQDRDIANRGAGKDPVSEDEILQILTKMVKQREESAKAFEEGGRAELAVQERAEIAIIREFMPSQLDDAAMRAAAQAAVDESDASGLRDMGRVMAILKERYPGRMDFSRASALVKELLG